MPFVDPTGEKTGRSDVPQPDLGYTKWEDDAPTYPNPLGADFPDVASE